MNRTKACGSCGKRLLTWYDAFQLEMEQVIWFGRSEIIHPCCENPRAQTKNDIVTNIIKDL